MGRVKITRTKTVTKRRKSKKVKCASCGRTL